MNQSCELSFLSVGAVAPQEVISPSRVKAVTHNSKTAVRLTIQHECVCPRVSRGAAGGWFSSSLPWFMPDTSQYSKKSQHGQKRRGGEKKKTLFTFTCFAFLPAWARMTFHFLLQVISKGLIQFALQAVSNPLSLLNFSLHRLNTRTFAVWLSFNGKCGAFWHSCW